MSFSKTYTPLRGVNTKKFPEVTCRVQGNVHAKFGGDSSIGLCSKSEQTDRQKQTNRQAGLSYFICIESTVSFKCIFTGCASDLLK